MFEQRGCLEIVLADRQRGVLWFILRWILSYFSGLLYIYLLLSFLTLERQHLRSIKNALKVLP